MQDDVTVRISAAGPAGSNDKPRMPPDGATSAELGTSVEARHIGGALVLRGLGELDERLAALVAEAAAGPGSVPIVVDLSELTLTRPPVLGSLLQQLVPSIDRPCRPAVVVCKRLSARRIVRRAVRTALPVVATLDEALQRFQHPSRASSSGSWKV
jgi:hypothetical protein